MRYSLAVFSVLAAVIVGASSPAPARPAGVRAEAIQDRFCLQGRRSGYPGNCQFSTYAQCMATASGTGDGCGLNPLHAYGEQRKHPYRARY